MLEEDVQDKIIGMSLNEKIAYIIRDSQTTADATKLIMALIDAREIEARLDELSMLRLRKDVRGGIGIEILDGERLITFAKRNRELRAELKQRKE